MLCIVVLTGFAIFSSFYGSYIVCILIIVLLRFIPRFIWVPRRTWVRDDPEIESGVERCICEVDEFMVHAYSISSMEYFVEEILGIISSVIFLFV